MKIKLLKNIERMGRVKVVARPNRTPIAFYPGVEVEVSDATGAKWIKEGLAQEVKPVKSALIPAELGRPEALKSEKAKP